MGTGSARQPRPMQNAQQVDKEEPRPCFPCVLQAVVLRGLQGAMSVRWPDVYVRSREFGTKGIDLGTQNQPMTPVHGVLPRETVFV